MLAPAGETCAQTTIESNICTISAVSLNEASVSKNNSKTPDWLKRQYHFQMLFQLPKRSGKAPPRDMMNRKIMQRFEEKPVVATLLTTTGQTTPKNLKPIRQSRSVIFVDMPISRIDRRPINHSIRVFGIRSGCACDNPSIQPDITVAFFF